MEINIFYEFTFGHSIERMILQPILLLGRPKILLPFLWLAQYGSKVSPKVKLTKDYRADLNNSVQNEPWVLDTKTWPLRESNQVTYKHPKTLVHSFIMCDTRDWATALLQDYFHPDDIPLILGLRSSNTWSMDGYAWNHTKSGVYTVKSGYDLS